MYRIRFMALTYLLKFGLFHSHSLYLTCHHTFVYLVRNSFSRGKWGRERKHMVRLTGVRPKKPPLLMVRNLSWESCRVGAVFHWSFVWTSQCDFKKWTVRVFQSTGCWEEHVEGFIVLFPRSAYHAPFSLSFSLKNWLSELVHLTCCRICVRALSGTIHYHNKWVSASSFCLPSVCLLSLNPEEAGEVSVLPVCLSLLLRASQTWQSCMKHFYYFF